MRSEYTANDQLATRADVNRAAYLATRTAQARAKFYEDCARAQAEAVCAFATGEAEHIELGSRAALALRLAISN